MPRLSICRRRTVWILAAALLCTGCSSFLRRGQDEVPVGEVVQLPETVGEATRPHGLGHVEIEAVGLVTGLSGTGSDPAASQLRQRLLEEMGKRSIKTPNQWLREDDTALVVLSAKLPPGVRKGDRIDVDVRSPARSKTTSLEGGWLLEASLREVAILNDSLRTGRVRGAVEGPVLTNAMLKGVQDDVGKTRGVVLGGGVATQDRPIGLNLRSDHHHVTVSKMIGKAINDRFDTYIRGRRQGTATAQTDTFVALTVHPRYRNNLARYFRVIEQIRLRENEMQMLERLPTLEAELLVPATAQLTALRLEAIGDEARHVLEKGLTSSSQIVRFMSAESLAYLDGDDAAPVLGRAVANQPALRARALLALSAMSSVSAREELTNLLHVDSVETRYGAFQALQRMNPRDPALGQEALGAGLYLHLVDSDGVPLVHVSRVKRAEVVAFGKQQPLATPLLVLVGKKLVIKSQSDGQLKVTRFAPGREDQAELCPANLPDLLRLLGRMEATYPEVVNTVQQLKQQGALQSRLEFDATPESDRQYELNGDKEPQEDVPDREED